MKKIYEIDEIEGSQHCHRHTFESFIMCCVFHCESFNTSFEFEGSDADGAINRGK